MVTPKSVIGTVDFAAKGLVAILGEDSIMYWVFPDNKGVVNDSLKPGNVVIVTLDDTKFGHPKVLNVTPWKGD